MANGNDVDRYVISHTETFNKYLLTISSAAFPAIGYLMINDKESLTGLKWALGLFYLAIILNMLTLLLIIDHPSPKGCLDRFIYYSDWAAFLIFCVAIGIAWYSI
jgi:hypothetical protein